MKNIYLFLIFLLLFMSVSLFSQERHFMVFDKPIILDSLTKNGYLDIQMEGLSIGDLREGVPALPSRIIQLLIPNDKEIDSMYIENKVIRTLYLEKKVVPFQGRVPIVDTVRRNFILPIGSIYENDSYFPKTQTILKEINLFDYNNQIASIEINPFQYNPIKDELSYYSSFDLRLIYKEKRTMLNKNTQEIFLKTEKKIQLYNSVLKKSLDNPEKAEVFSLNNRSLPIIRSVGSTPIELNYEYVVITSSELASSFERFVMWKRRKGLNIGIVTMDYIRNNYSGDLISGINDDAGKLRQFLFDCYKNNLVYALFGGDKDNVPIRFGSAQNNPSDIVNYVIPTDIYFADFNGNWNVDNDQFYGEPTHDAPDFASEIFVGRLLCTTNQEIENWTDKLITYELNPGRGNFNYLKKAFYTQADQMQSGDWASTIKNTFTMFTTNTVFEETFNGVKNPNSSGLPEFPTGADVINEFNNNYGLVSFMGHGGPCNVSVSNTKLNEYPKHRVYTSQNVHPDYPNGGGVGNMCNIGFPNIHYSIACETMPFDNNIPSHEGHLSLGKYLTTMSKTGHVAYLGNTRYGWITSSRDLFRYFGEKINLGNYKIGVAEALSLTQTSDKYLKYSHNLLGCPEMEIWTDIPQYFSSMIITEGGNNVTVNTGGITNAKICIMSASDNGASYFQVIENAPQSYTFVNVVKPYLITVTKHNYIPYLHPKDVYIQNKTYTSGNVYISGENIYMGDNVTNTQVSGPVIVTGNSNLKLDATKEIELQKGFEVHVGASFTTR